MTTVQVETHYPDGETVAAGTIEGETKFETIMRAARWLHNAKREHPEADHYVLANGGALILFAEN